MHGGVASVCLATVYRGSVEVVIVADTITQKPQQGDWLVNDLLAWFPEPDGKRYEIIAGVLYVHQPHWQHQVVADSVVLVLKLWNRQTRTGQVISAPGLIAAPDRAVIPDVVWVRRERLAAVLHKDGKLHGAPDLVVEVLSPGRENEERDRVEKRALYSNLGVQEYWIVDRFQHQVEIYRSVEGMLQMVACEGEHDTITSPLLPGFACTVAEVLDV